MSLSANLPADSKLANMPVSPVYPAQSITTLISRAWNLLRCNLKASLLLMLAPTLVLMVSRLLFSIPASQTFLTPTLGQQLAITLASSLLGLLVAIVSYFVWGGCTCALIRLYYSAITQRQPLNLRECLQPILRYWPGITLTMTVLGLVLIIFMTIDFVILFFGLMMSTAAIPGLIAYVAAKQSLLLIAMIVLFFLLFGSVVLAVIISLTTVQSVCFFAPFITLATGPKPGTFSWKRCWNVIRLELANAPRLLLFTLAFFGFSLVLSITLNTPAILWHWFETTRLGVEQQYMIPFHVQAVTNLWASFVGLFLMPFHTAALVLFWYDCQVRKEGLDLQLWLQNLRYRRGLHAQTASS